MKNNVWNTSSIRKNGSSNSYQKDLKEKYSGNSNLQMNFHYILLSKIFKSQYERIHKW
ncbi:hypothetical protein MXM59_13605 [Mammaliicoccus sciuri]|uniref:hypothetical protein n=1 Tax=Mammaliicoccus TaxID=2803850 RepID=UPI00194E522A|nr:MULTISPECIES: hypothetical protein [Mammaliicoccus]MCD8837357.1 hypothetical protein [Mammaliicoccus sciuri]MEB6228263.1 hypothetical protein [Mammaliicoccus sciuri]